VRTLDASLSDVLGSPGTVGVLLVDAVSGLGYASAGDTGAIGTGGELAELAELVAEQLHEAGAEGELENIVVSSRRRHHIVQVVPRHGDPLLLAVVIDREQTNLALALRQTATQAGKLLA
jgi:hypothetical protein